MDPIRTGNRHPRALADADPASTYVQSGAASAVVNIQGIDKHYDSDAGPVRVLRGIALSIARGEAVAIKGVSGSGKSTLLHILGAVEKPDRGTIHICNENIGALDTRAQTSFRARHIGFVFQFFNLIQTLTARENVVAALEPLGGNRTARDQAAAAALDAVGLAAHADKYPSQLSGGQQQRVAIARAIAKKPTLLLADEPTGALDAQTARQVLDLLNKIRREHGCAVVIATHDPIVSNYVDRVIRIERGQLHPEMHKDMNHDA